MFRVVAEWTGFSGAPGYSNFFFQGPEETEATAQLAVNAVRAFFEAIRNDLPAGVTINVSPVVGEVNRQDGVLGDEIQVGTAPAAVVGQGTGGWSAASGTVVNWRTATIVRGRRVRGRTFLVPLQSGSYDNQGTLTTGALGVLRAAANTLAGFNGAGGLRFVVWSRPRAGVLGSTAPVEAAQVNDRVAILRSRRD